MDFEVLAYLSWREALFAVAGLLALYVLVVYLRIRRLRKEHARLQEMSEHAAQSAVAVYAAVQQEPSEAQALAENAAEQNEHEPTGKAFPWNEPPADSPELRKIETLEQEIALLRREVGALRAEVTLLRDEQRREISKVQVAQNASPFYSEAMQMALQGQDAAGISQLCGISRAEAELVVALARNQEDSP